MNRKRSIRFVSVVMVFALMLGTLAACGGQQAAPSALPTATVSTEVVAPQMATPEAAEEAADAGDVVEGGQVTIAMWSPPNNFNALNTDSSYGFFNVNIIFPTLVRFTEDVEFAPRLADSWEISEDNTEFTFNLNPDAVWHDGTPVTAEDIEFTIWAISHPQIEVNRGANISMLAGLDGSKRPEGVETVEGVEVIDEHTIKFTTANAVDPLSFLEQMGTAIYIVPKHILQDVAPEDFAQADFWMNPTVGAGPFKFVRYETDQFIEYEANEEYYLGAPHLDKLIVKIINPSTMVAQLEKGELDMVASGGIGDVPLDDWERVQELENVDAYSYQDNGYQYMIINGDDELGLPWSDKNVRQALAYGINRQLIVDKLLKGQGIVAQSPIIPVTYYYNPEIEGEFAYDPDKARELLAEAGWDPNTEVTLLVPIGNIVRELSADIIQSNLAEIGMNVSIEKMDFPTMISRFQAGEFDLGLVGWADILDPDVRSQFQTDGQYNFGKFSSEILDQLLEEGANTADPEARKAIYDEFQVQFMQEMPMVPLYWPLRLAAINDRVQNARHMIGTNNLQRNLNEWWVTDGQ